jgi:gluconolactonase
MAFDPNGNNILRIPTGTGATNNTFAGRDDKLLFITGPVDSVTGIKMKVKGAPNW